MSQTPFCWIGATRRFARRVETRPQTELVEMS
jgi:hypothetical protein